MRKFQHYSLVALFCIAFSVAPTERSKALPITSTSTETVTGFANATGSNAPNAFQIVFSGLPTDSATGGVLTLETFGDFNGETEWINISVDGTSFGRLWDINPANDSFEGFLADDDKGQQYGTFGTNAGATLQFSESQLDAFLADGSFVLGFETFGPDVDDHPDEPQDEFIKATLEFEVADTIPEPTTSIILLSLIGMRAICGCRRKDRV